MTPSLVALILFGSFLTLIILRIPVAFALALACLPVFLLEPRLTPILLLQEMFRSYNAFVLRYRVEDTEDGLSGEEGTFTTCSFWLVSALVAIGELTKARALCSKLLFSASPLQLYAEEIDPRSGRHLGNFPQAFTHLALINAVTAVIEGERRLTDGRGRLSPPGSE